MANCAINRRQMHIIVSALRQSTAHTTHVHRHTHTHKLSDHNCLPLVQWSMYFMRFCVYIFFNLFILLFYASFDFHAQLLWMCVQNKTENTPCCFFSIFIVIELYLFRYCCCCCLFIFSNNFICLHPRAFKLVCVNQTNLYKFNKHIRSFNWLDWNIRERNENKNQHTNRLPIFSCY